MIKHNKTSSHSIKNGDNFIDMSICETYHGYIWECFVHQEGQEEKMSMVNHNMFSVWLLLVFCTLRFSVIGWYISPAEYQSKVSPDCSGWLILCPLLLKKYTCIDFTIKSPFESAVSLHFKLSGSLCVEQSLNTRGVFWLLVKLF